MVPIFLLNEKVELLSRYIRGIYVISPHIFNILYVSPTSLSAALVSCLKTSLADNVGRWLAVHVESSAVVYVLHCLDRY